MDWRNNVFVIGHPRSGNTWTARLLGDVLKSRVTGFEGEKPIAEDGPRRRGKYIVRQSHLRASYRKDSKSLVYDWCFCIENYDKDNAPAIVHVLRDPRDVIVSTMYYWELSDLSVVYKRMIAGDCPVGCSWGTYVREWLDAIQHLDRITTIRYTDLQNDTEGELRRILDVLELQYDASRIPSAIKRQSFDRKLKQIESGKGIYSYNPAIQSHHMRKGIVGDWKNHFDKETGRMVEEAFGELMDELGFEKDRDWWKKL